MNFVFAFLVYALLFAVGRRRAAVERAARRRRDRRACRPSAPASRPGDRIVAIDGTAGRDLGGALEDGAWRRSGEPLHADASSATARRSELDVTPALQESRTLFGEEAGKRLPHRHRGRRTTGSASARSRRSAWPAQQTWTASADGREGPRARWCRGACRCASSAARSRSRAPRVSRRAPARATSSACSRSCRSTSAC